MADSKEAQPVSESPKPQDKADSGVIVQDVDDFGLPTKRLIISETAATQDETEDKKHEDATSVKQATPQHQDNTESQLDVGGQVSDESKKRSTNDDDAGRPGTIETPPGVPQTKQEVKSNEKSDKDDSLVPASSKSQDDPTTNPTIVKVSTNKAASAEADNVEASAKASAIEQPEKKTVQFDVAHSRKKSEHDAGASGFSHQQLSTEKESEDKQDDDEGWQEMPAYARYDMYDDDDRLIAREHNEDEIEKYGYAEMGGAGKGYTRVLEDDDADSVDSLDENTQYLFKDANGTSMVDDDEARDAVSQMQATKDLLTEGQRIAYVGVVRLEIANMTDMADKLESTYRIKKEINMAAEAMRMWGQKMMIRLYTHMDISEAEQIMIEQLAEHGVRPQDLTPALHANARVRNPMAEEQSTESSTDKAGPPTPSAPGDSPPPYEEHDAEHMADVKTPSQLPKTEKIDIDLRWTVLCDLFLVLIADSIYDARSRILLEKVAKSLDLTWLDICRFEKKVTDALEMQQAAEKENWNESEHLENRRKAALTKRYVMMGLATVGGGLVIGLSGGIMAPLIGGGLAAGLGLFSTAASAGASTFLTGVGGIALITSGAATTGGIIGGKAANRRTGAVQTFEYRPLHNNKRANLIVTVSGWLTGKVDDVRLPFSTVDPIMGDIYSVLWEPEMLRSMGDTINILATEALTQGLQQILGSTVLMALMAGLQVPLILTKLSYLIDNPWSVSLDRATSAGLILADSLIDRNLGTRPVTLVGYSLGSRVIFSCLQELARKGAYGLVQNVYMFGSPIVVKKHQYLRARSVVSGRFVNGYHRNDWILGYLFRLTNGGIRRVAGLGPIEELPWIENMDVTEMVAGHMDYRTAVPVLLMNCGWMVDSEEFTEIEDPDPDNHKDRQRELINEIEEARKQLEREGKAGKRSRFSFFGRGKKGDKQEWEVYEDSTSKSGKVGEADGKGTQGSSNTGVLFDVDAIRAELAKEGADGEELQVREIKSTLPPMKLDLSSPPLSVSAEPRGSLRETKSAELLPIRAPGSARSVSSSYATPSQPRSHSPATWNYGGVDHEDEVQMSFDTSFDDPKPTVPPKTDDASRPGMKTSKTLPNLTLSDPWGDPDDDDFGKEKEISMTFA